MGWYDLLWVEVSCDVEVGVLCWKRMKIFIDGFLIDYYYCLYWGCGLFNGVGNDWFDDYGVYFVDGLMCFFLEWF